MKRFAARYVYPLAADSLPLRNAFVEMEDDGTVVRVGLCDRPEEEPVFFEGALVPGFVNTHCHLELSYMRGLFRRGTGMAGFIDQINALRDTVSPEEKIKSIRYWMDMMRKRGVTALADISNCADSFAVKAEVSASMYIRTFLEVFGTEPEDCASVMEGVRALQAKAAEAGLGAAPTPHACYTMSPQLLTAASAAGLASGYLSYHSQESPQEEELIRSGTGEMAENRRRAGMSTPPVTGASSLRYFLDRLEEALPAPVPGHVLLVHAVCMDQDDVREALRRLQHPFIALCPLSNLYIHKRLPDVEMLRRSGIPLTVGTDSLSSNEDLDMVAELHCLQEHFPSLSTGELLWWACRNGAEFLGRGDVLGSLATSKRPGLVLISGLDAEGRLTPQSMSRRVR